MKTPSIKLSFTALSLGVREADAVVPLWNRLRDWEAVGAMVIENNLLKRTSVNSSKRIFREVRQRLEMLSHDTLSEYAQYSHQDRSIILLIAATVYYPFIKEFINTTISDKVLVFDYTLAQNDFIIFWNRMELTHPEMEGITETTKKKIRQVLWRILAEASLLSSTKHSQITPIIPSSQIITVLKKEKHQIHSAFLQ